MHDACAERGRLKITAGTEWNTLEKVMKHVVRFELLWWKRTDEDRLISEIA